MTMYSEFNKAAWVKAHKDNKKIVEEWATEVAETAVNRYRSWRRYSNIEASIRNGHVMLYDNLARDYVKPLTADEKFNLTLRMPTIADIIQQSVEQFEQKIPLNEQKFKWQFPLEFCRNNNIKFRTVMKFDMNDYMTANKVTYNNSYYEFKHKKFYYNNEKENNL